MVVSFRPTSHGWLVEKKQPRRTAEKRKPKEFNLFQQFDKVRLIQLKKVKTTLFIKNLVRCIFLKRYNEPSLIRRKLPLIIA